VIEIVESLGPYAQDAVIEDIEDVYTGEVTTGMARTGGLDEP
jgi:hypothetical protein